MGRVVSDMSIMSIKKSYLKRNEMNFNNNLCVIFAIKVTADAEMAALLDTQFVHTTASNILS